MAKAWATPETTLRDVEGLYLYLYRLPGDTCNNRKEETPELKTNTILNTE
jgi:hypothetical protein